jgi:LCP family protein required for cell wall assembly
MTRGERLVLTSVVAVNILIYLVVIVLAWEALPQPPSVAEMVVGYFPTTTPVAVAGSSTMLQPDPPGALSPVASSTPMPTLPPSALACPPPAGWSAYFVQNGDTLFSLARTYELAVDEVKSTNCLESDLIQVDQILFLPLPTSTPTATASPTPPPNASPTFTPTPTEPPLPVTAPTPVAPLTMDPNAVNIVLLGTDIRTPGSAWRTDTIILVTVNTRLKTAGMLSIPRDLWVYIPRNGYNRINTADFYGEYRKYPGGGPALVKRTLLHNLGVPVHYYLRGDFNALIKLIDTLGGVDVAVDCPLEDIFPDPTSPGGLYTLSLDAGIQNLDGKASLFYARSRLSTSDFDRSRRQQKVLRGLWDKSLRIDILPKVPELWRTLSSAVQTDLNLTDVLALASIGVQLEPQNLKSRFIGRDQVRGWVAPGGAQVLLPRPAEMQVALVEFFAPPVQEISALTAEGARVVVRNGTDRSGLAALATDRLRWEGIPHVAAANADRQDYFQTRLTVYTSKPRTEARLIELFRVSPENIQRIPDQAGQAEADIVVVLGYDYNPCRR